jgi:hypothetical protein
VPSTIGIVPTGLHRSMTLHHQAVRGEGREEEDECHISVVTGPIGESVIHRTARISISPWGRPQGPLAPWTTTMPPILLIPFLTASGLPPAILSSEAGPSGSGTPSDLKNLCGNRLLRWFAHHAAPSGNGRVPGSWDSMPGLAGERMRKRGAASRNKSEWIRISARQGHQEEEQEQED